MLPFVCLKAQSFEYKEIGVILIKDGATYYLENVTKDTLSVLIVNVQEKVESLNNVLFVHSGDHPKVEFSIPPNTKKYIPICIHSVGFIINSKTNIEFNFN